MNKLKFRKQPGVRRGGSKWVFFFFNIKQSLETSEMPGKCPGFPASSGSVLTLFGYLQMKAYSEVS